MKFLKPSIFYPKEYNEVSINKMKEAFPNTEVVLQDLDAAFVTQGGPQCVAIQYVLR